MVIIIPCYNEYSRLNKNDFTIFLTKNHDVKIIFSDDASVDGTINILEDIQANFKSQVYVLKLQTNLGKGEAIRKGVIYAFEQNISFNKIAYLDADLSVSLEECFLLASHLNHEKLVVFGSRISKIDNTIIRNYFRHYSGRFLATIISMILKISIYDSQCGCKIFDTKLAREIFQEPFISRWLFDVELFFRIKKLYSLKDLKEMSLEIPLSSWIDKSHSKVKLTYFFKMWQDLYLINKKYEKY
jgi:dolichyl-phosphate beta-glucosyltransferase